MIGKIHKHVNLIPLNVNHSQNIMARCKEEKIERGFRVRPEFCSFSICKKIQS